MCSSSLSAHSALPHDQLTADTSAVSVGIVGTSPSHNSQQSTHNEGFGKGAPHVLPRDNPPLPVAFNPDARKAEHSVESSMPHHRRKGLWRGTVTRTGDAVANARHVARRKGYYDGKAPVAREHIASQKYVARRILHAAYAQERQRQRFRRRLWREVARNAWVERGPLLVLGQAAGLREALWEAEEEVQRAFIRRQGRQEPAAEPLQEPAPAAVEREADPALEGVQRDVHALEGKLGAMSGQLSLLLSAVAPEPSGRLPTPKKLLGPFRRNSREQLQEELRRCREEVRASQRLLRSSALQSDKTTKLVTSLEAQLRSLSAARARPAPRAPSLPSAERRPVASASSLSRRAATVRSTPPRQNSSPDPKRHAAPAKGFTAWSRTQSLAASTLPNPADGGPGPQGPQPEKNYYWSGGYESEGPGPQRKPRGSKEKKLQRHRSLGGAGLAEQAACAAYRGLCSWERMALPSDNDDAPDALEPSPASSRASSPRHPSDSPSTPSTAPASSASPSRGGSPGGAQLLPMLAGKKGAGSPPSSASSLSSVASNRLGSGSLPSIRVAPISLPAFVRHGSASAALLEEDDVEEY